MASKHELAKMLIQSAGGVQASDPFTGLAKGITTGLGYRYAMDASDENKAVRKQMAEALARGDKNAALSFAGQSDDPDLQKVALTAGLTGQDNPSAVKEYEYYNKLPDAAKKDFLNVKRAQQALNLGGSYGILGSGGQIEQQIPKTLAPENLPETKMAQAEATEKGRSMGEKGVLLNSSEAKMPQLESAVSSLSELGKTATYTKAGQARDFIARQLGAQVPDSAVARAEYISRVDNEILPLLRDTFGAAFTQKEGDSLKATLGDPNMAPKEKDAVLKSFIETKRATIGSMRRELGANPTQPAQSAPKFLGFE